MATPDMNALDSTASDSFEIGNDVAAAASDSPDILVEEPRVNEADTGSDWFDEQDFSFNKEETAPAEENEETSLEQPAEVDSSDSSDPETSGDTISIDVRRKNHEFKLDAEDETLRRTLRNGVRAQSIKADNDKLKANMAELSASMEEAKEATEVFAELNSLASEGDFDRIVQAVLGEQYQTYLEGKIDDYINYQNSDPAERARIDAERSSKQASYAERAKDNKIKELEAKLENQSVSSEEGKLHGYATTSLRSSAITEAEVPDSDIRNRLNKRLWSSSWDSIKQLSKTREITPTVIEAVFKREAKLSRYGLNKAGDSITQATLEKKKEQAAATAGAIATSNHPKPASGRRDVSSWDGKDARDVLKFFR